MHSGTHSGIIPQILHLLEDFFLPLDFTLVNLNPGFWNKAIVLLVTISREAKLDHVLIAE